MSAPASELAWIHPSLHSLAVPIDSLTLDPRNARRHPKKNIAAIRDVLAQVGQLKPIVVDGDNIVRAGNGTLIAAKQLGYTHIARVPWDEKDEYLKRLFSVADNRVAELAEWDPDALSDHFDFLKFNSIGKTEIAGFNADEVHELLEKNRLGTGTGVEEVETPPPPVVPVTRLGDVWSFPTGHRVICGDATNPDAWTLLMLDERADCVHTDPPYGVAYESNGSAPIRNDQLEGDALELFLTLALRNVERVANEAAAFYVWYASDTRAQFERALLRVGLVERQQVVWVKPHHTLGRADYQWQHEPCFYASKDAHQPAFYGARAESTVWILATTEENARAIALGAGVTVSDGKHSLYVQARAPRTKKQRTIRIEPGQQLVLLGDEETSDVWMVAREARPEHPTQKPVALAARAIRNSTQPGHLVVDAFLGSGSTLLAAEQLGRRCYAVELDAAYVDVAIERYIKLTGRAPVNQRGEPYRRRES